VRLLRPRQGQTTTEGEKCAVGHRVAPCGDQPFSRPRCQRTG